ncbi:MAG TPA: galactokinase [Polyangiaceae bacterium]|nr:galactokinase [Polyangiaceae bacterium]
MSFTGVEPLALARAFSARFGRAPRVFSAPGRVNLIGEHTDYNDGFVLPMAIERRTYVAAAPRSDRVVRVHSQNLGSDFSFDLDRPGPPQRGVWGDYVEGMAHALRARGIPVAGADLLIESEVPAGAGLSASAALELSVGYALTVLAGVEPPDRRMLALSGQAAEHEYVGTLCGIMDQYISALGGAGQALLIDCRSLEPRAVPLSAPGTTIVICDTRVKHQLASSEYNKRHAECRAGVEGLKPALPGIRALRDVTVEDLERHGHLLPELVRRRCRHVVSENARTLAAADALERGDLAAVGALMVASHRSLQHDFEVSCAELDVAVEAALAVPGVYGARMTGGGFGGCTVTLVETRAVPALLDAVRDRFVSAFGIQPELFPTTACEGAREHPLG